jgi:divalent metal cation (Fe/Co/Zn/Cd) transporter
MIPDMSDRHDSTTPASCLCVEPAASQSPQLRKWARVALGLVALTLGYNVIEALVALWAGERAESIALLGFGIDSIIECSAGVLLLWRLSVETGGADRGSLDLTDRRVHRFVGVTFYLLALYIVAQAGWTIWRRTPPQKSVIGIVLAAASLVLMPLLSWGKLVAARRIGSRALRAEAKETLVCSYLSFTLLLGLLANAGLGWWWADPVAALLMIPWLIKEGTEGVRGESCGCGKDDSRTL